MPTPSSSVTPMSRTTGLLAAAGVLLIGSMALLQPIPPAVQATQSSPAGATRPCTLRPDGFLRGRFYGALNLTANWSGANLDCDGMPRPDGEGIRLFFAREQPDGGRVAVLIGIDGRMEDLRGADRPANVTIIDQRAGRFFSSGRTGRCWATINSVTALARAGGGQSGHRIAGLLYCVGALPSVGDHSSLTLGELSFAGRVTGQEG